LSRSWPLGLASLVTYSYYLNLDTIIMAATRSPREAGIYSGAYRLFLALNIVTIFSGFAHLPILARIIQSGSQSARSILTQGFEDLTCYGILIIGAGELAGRPLLGLLFGSQFEAAGPTFLLLCVAAAWYSVGYYGGYSLIAEGRTRAFLAGATAAGCMNLVLDVILIPRVGLIGGGIATACAFATAALVWLRSREPFDKGMTRLVGGLTFASVGALLALLIPGSGMAIGVITVASALGSVGLLLTRRRMVAK